MKVVAVLFGVLAVALASDWVVLDEGLGMVSGVQFIDANTAVAVGLNKISRSVNGGTSFTQIVMNSTQTIRYTDIAMSGSYMVASGAGDTNNIGGSSYSADKGLTWYNTDESHLRNVWNNVEPIPLKTGYFVMAGEWTDAVRSGTGVALSTDGGKTWTNRDWGMGTNARYVSFPTSSVGYVTGGVENLFNSSLNRAVIAKTTDTGRSFTKQLDVSGKYYLNGISFADQTNGWAIAVYPTGTTIMHTTNGGTTWADQSTFADVKLTFIRMISATEGWTCGGYEDGAFYHGQLLHTTNGGVSWTAFEERGFLMTNIRPVDSTHVYASAEAELGGGAVLKYVP